MDIGQVIALLWQQLVASLGSEVLSVLVVAGFAVALVSISLVVSAFRRTEFFKQHESLWNLVDGQIADLVWLISEGDVDLTEQEKRVEERRAAGLTEIDPRMLYLIDRAQEWVKKQFGVELDFEMLLARAEHIYDEVRSADGNSVGKP